MLTVVSEIACQEDFLIQKDLKNFFAKLNLNLNLQPFFDQSTYGYNHEDWDQTWLYFAFEAFKKLAKRGYSIDSFATIGTGSGIDAIGALRIFKPQRIILTDLNDHALRIAELNLKNYLRNNPNSYQILQGNICEPLLQQKLKMDLIYANLPNISVKEKINYFSIDSASLIEERFLSPDCKKYQEYLLTTTYQFLKTAKSCLAAEGKVLLNIGARVPGDLLKVIFEELEYTYEEISNGFKLQTEAELILKGYSNFERNGVQFDFYFYEEAIKILNKYKNNHFSIEEMKLLLKNLKINSLEALQLFYQGKKVGHLVSLILGQQRT